ncbi:MAG TPA: hypothetical protein PLZ29_12360 [Spirochaetota bacterium]|nr:hypothetical protein [Spirochaetota bacterium]
MKQKSKTIEYGKASSHLSGYREIHHREHLIATGREGNTII